MMPTPDWKYDAARGRYRRNGRFVSAETVTAFVDKFLATQQDDIADNLFELLRNGRLSVKELQLLGEREIAKAHLNAAMAAKGGRAQMAQADYGRVGGYVKPELGHWRDLMVELENGRNIDGSVKASLRNYFAAAANTFFRVEQLEMQKRGFDEYRNVLNDSGHHCRDKKGRPSCRTVTERGWQKIGTLPERGKRACWWNCKCRWEYRNSRAQVNEREHQAVMSLDEAIQWAKGGAYTEPVFHTTPAENLGSIYDTGLRLAPPGKGFGRAFGDGLYLSVDEAGTQFWRRGIGADAVTVELRTDIENFVVWNVQSDDFGSVISQVEGREARYQSKVNALIDSGLRPGPARAAALRETLMEEGIDGILIVDEPLSFPTGGSQLIVFDPQRVVVIRDSEF